MIEKFGVYTLEDSPYIMYLLTLLRDKNTKSREFRQNLSLMGRYIAYELTKTFNIIKFPVETPLEKTEGITIEDMENTVVISILRAAIPFMEGFLEIFSEASIGFISARRGPPPDFKIEVNYSKIPEIDEKVVIILDPMIATGSTLSTILRKLFNNKAPKRKIVAGVLAAPEGIERIRKNFSDVEIYVAAIDRKLNSKGYILPGLGDAGDRALNTNHQ